MLIVPIRSGLWRLRSVRQPIGALVGPLILAGGLSAQTLPVPILPPEPPPETGLNPQTAGTAGTIPETAPPRPWEYGLGIGLGYDSNIDFRVPDGPSSWAITPRGNFARVLRSSQGQLRLGGAANWIGYQDQEELSRYNIDISLDGNYRSSSTVTWRGGASYEFGHSDHSRVLLDQGVLLPLVKTRTAAGGLGVTRAVGVLTSLRLDGRLYRVEFDQQDLATLGLRNGQSLRATAGLERRFGSRDSTALEYSLESTASQSAETVEGSVDRNYLTHFGSLQFSRLLSPRSGLLVEVGASYTPEAPEAGMDRRQSFYGGATYSRRVGLSSVVLFARREVVPAFGLGVSRIQNRFGLSTTIPIRRAWNLQFSGTYNAAETPEGAPSTYGDRAEASAILTRRLGRHFEVSSEGRYSRRGATSTFPEIEQYRVGVFLSLVSSPGASGGRSGP